jgi:osmotically-inducible protein OsmY
MAMHRENAGGGAMNARHGIGLVVLAVMAAAVAGTGAAAGVDPAAQEKTIAKLLVAKLGDDAGSIRVTWVKGTVTLTGAVRTRAVKELAKEVALTAAGVKKVDNQVSSESTTAFGKGKLREEAVDAELETDVKKALKAEVGSHAKTIEVEACDGWVSLRGPVPDAARRDIALKTAAQVKGVVKVVDLVTVAR